MNFSSFLSERRYRVYLTTLVGTFITVVDATASFIAVPTIALDLAVSLPVAQWVIIGNMLALTAVLVPAGGLSDLLGRKRLFVSGYAILGLGALLAGLATDMTVLIFARVVMGLGAALTQSTSIPIVVSAFSPSERGRVLGGQMGVVGLGTVLGPVLGGVIVGLLGWRAIYWVTAVVAFGVALLGVRVLKRRADQVVRRIGDFDLVGAGLSIAFLVVLLAALSNGARVGWTQPAVLISVLASVVLGVGFVLWEKRAAAPMLDVSLFRLPDFTMGLVTAVVAFMAMSGAYFLLPFYLQLVLGFSPQAMGVLLVPAGIVTALGAPVIGHMADRVGHRRVATLGVTINGLALVSLSFLQVNGSAFTVVFVLMFLSLGIASFYAPNSSAMLAAVADESHGIASGFINLARNLGNVVGIAAGTAIVTATMAARGLPPSLAAVADNGDNALVSAFVDGMSRSTLTLGLLCLLLTIIRLVRRP